uniref:Uncharacterized protein n=1 Tax=Arundo donax TaxID=35708 RepID=A0A0A9DKK3_ARUDO
MFGWDGSLCCNFVYSCSASQHPDHNISAVRTVTKLTRVELIQLLKKKKRAISNVDQIYCLLSVNQEEDKS